jgi:hypothetical protein
MSHDGGSYDLDMFPSPHSIGGSEFRYAENPHSDERTAPIEDKNNTFVDAPWHPRPLQDAKHRYAEHGCTYYKNNMLNPFTSCDPLRYGKMLPEHDDGDVVYSPIDT